MKKTTKVYLTLLGIAFVVGLITVCGYAFISLTMPFEKSDLLVTHYDFEMLIKTILFGINVLIDAQLIIFGLKYSLRNK